MKQEVRDVLVLGAGPAGSSLAQRLARAGLSVTLADRKVFPRFKPCGEFLSPECLPQLADLGVKDSVEARGARSIVGMRLFGYQRRARGEFRDIGASARPHDGGWAVRREVLDHELVLAAAARPEVEWLGGWGFVRPPRGAAGDGTGAVLRPPAQGARTVRARWTVGADGVSSRVARELGVQHRVPWLDKLALTTRYRGVPELDSAEVHVFPGGYFAATAVEDGLFSLNLVVDRACVRERAGSWDEWFAEHLARVPELAERMQHAQRVDRVRGIGPLAFRTREQVFDGAALCGDACGYVDPMTGEGIWFALRGAELLAGELTAAIHAGATQGSALRGYVRARRREIGPRLFVSSLLQRGLRHEGVARTVLGALQRRPGLADLLVSFSGDYVRFRELLRPGVWQAALARGDAA